MKDLDFPVQRIVDFGLDGYSHVRRIGQQYCALKTNTYTTAIVVGIGALSHERRYCYEHLLDAQRALEAWDGQAHSPGPWIKCKGAGLDFLNLLLGSKWDA